MSRECAVTQNYDPLLSTLSAIFERKSDVTFLIVSELARIIVVPLTLSNSVPCLWVNESRKVEQVDAQTNQ
jgi:hypothetical protein